MTINVIPFSLHWQSMAEKNITYDHKNDAIFNALAVGGGKGHNA